MRAIEMYIKYVWIEVYWKNLYIIVLRKIYTRHLYKKSVLFASAYAFMYVNVHSEISAPSNGYTSWWLIGNNKIDAFLGVFLSKIC